jgi:hypothetical protein
MVQRIVFIQVYTIVYNIDIELTATETYQSLQIHHISYKYRHT